MFEKIRFFCFGCIFHFLFNGPLQNRALLQFWRETTKIAFWKIFQKCVFTSQDFIPKTMGGYFFYWWLVIVIASIRRQKTIQPR